MVPGPGTAPVSHGLRPGAGGTGSLAGAPPGPGSGSWPGAAVRGAGAVVSGPGSRSGAVEEVSVAGAAAGCPRCMDPLLPAVRSASGTASTAGTPASRAAPACPRRVSRAATARSRVRPVPAPPGGLPPAGLPGSGSSPRAAAGTGERIASKSGAAPPVSGGRPVIRRPGQEIRARASPCRRPGPRR